MTLLRRSTGESFRELRISDYGEVSGVGGRHRASLCNVYPIRSICPDFLLPASTWDVILHTSREEAVSMMIEAEARAHHNLILVLFIP